MHTMLAVRTDFSVGESTLKTKDVITEAERVSQTAVAITDTMSVTAMIDFTKKAKEKDIKPIIGCRLRLTDDPTWRPGEGEKKKHMPRVYYLTVYALTQQGMDSIFRLLTLANSADRFYYVSKLGFTDLYEELDRIHPGDLAVCMSDEQSVLEHKSINLIAATLSKKVENVFAGVMPIATPYHARVNEISMGLITTYPQIEPLMIIPSLYKKDGADAQDIMTGICEGAKITDGWFKSRYVRDQHPIGQSEVVGRVKQTHEITEKRDPTNRYMPFMVRALSNTDKLVEMVQYQWEKAPVSLPQMAPDEFKAVVDECQKGWKTRFASPVFGHVPTDEDKKNIYMPRLKYELGVLKDLNFSGYFLLVQDIVRFAKDSDILVGPGRGSVGGSLVAYLMGITECDPIRFGLMFERFINPERIDLPDADLDFMSERRHEVIEYLIEKYGQDRVAGVSNFGTLAAASAIRDVSRIVGIPEREFSISKLVPKKHGQNVPLEEAREEVPEIEVFANKFPQFWNIMELLEGNVRNMSQHAAGVVVGGCDLVNRAVIERRKDNNVVCWDKKIVEEQGLVKVDILGLSTLDLLGMTLNYVKERHGKAPDIMSIPLDDAKVLERFAKGETTGVFQFESGGMRHLLKELGSGGVITFDDITAATALYRPGPMESGMMDSFYKRKQGLESIEYDHPLMEPILEPTYGVIVYQEQVMKISQAIAGYTGPQADKLRKIMGKKLPEEMKKERANFVKGCVDTIQCDDKWAGVLFDKIEGFAGYGFNKSHSVEYTMISYQAMWLKVNYPVEFYAGAMSILDSDKLPAVMRDAQRDGIEVAMPDINNSTGRFEIVTDTKLVIPFQRIKGISDKTTQAILTARKDGPFSDKNDFLARVVKRSCNIRHQKALDDVGAFAFIETGQVAPDDPSRIKDQIELVPGLVTATVPINRDMNRDKLIRDRIGELVDEYIDENADSAPVKPHFGRVAKYMIISDAPGNEEDGNGAMGFSRANQAVIDAMENAGLNMKDCYWTAMSKVVKSGRQVSPEEIALYKKYLDAEISILQPPVIVLMGSITTRTFFPDFRGKASEAAGKVEYKGDYDANMVIAFSPGEIYHDPDKQNNMNAVFERVAALLE